jgi:WD40 repeat protein
VELRLTEALLTGQHNGEVFCCMYTTDGAFVLSGGWDGMLRLWTASSGSGLTAVRVSPKPLSACAVSPDGRAWVAGSMEGLITFWDACSHVPLAQTPGHTRPVSAICFTPDGKVMATSSWDRNICVGKPERDRDVRMLSGHADIVGGCRFLPDGDSLLSWSHDTTLRLWDVGSGRERAVFRGHKDRVTAGAVSPDGLWVASGSRAGELFLWDLEKQTQAAMLDLSIEIRGCFFLLDGVSLLTVDAEGCLAFFALPELRPLTKLDTHCPLQCADLSPLGNQVALGCDDGQVRFVVIDGLEDRPLMVTATEGTRQVSSGWSRLFGRSHTTPVFETVCPACRQPVEILDRLPRDPFPCPHCRRALRSSPRTRPAPAAC